MHNGHYFLYLQKHTCRSGTNEHLLIVNVLGALKRGDMISMLECSRMLFCARTH